MRFCLSATLPLLLSIGLWGGLSNGPARAEFALVDRADAWYFYTQRGVGRRNAACQIVSCVNGVCGAGTSSRTQFSFYDARDGLGATPEFVAPKRVRPSQTAILEVEDKLFVLRNLFSSPQYYLQIEQPDHAEDIISALRDLETRNKLGSFYVVDPQGSRHEFLVQGITESLDHMMSRCGS